MSKVAPYGAWESPITSDVVVQKAISLEKVSVDPFDEGASTGYVVIRYPGPRGFLTSRFTALLLENLWHPG